MQLLPRLQARTHYLYIHIDPGARELLYVGRASQRDHRRTRWRDMSINRTPAHRARIKLLRKQGWATDQIAHVVVEGLTYATAKHLEAALIRHLRPPFNRLVAKPPKPPRAPRMPKPAPPAKIVAPRVKRPRVRKSEHYLYPKRPPGRPPGAKNKVNRNKSPPVPAYYPPDYLEFVAKYGVKSRLSSKIWQPLQVKPKGSIDK